MYSDGGVGAAPECVAMAVASLKDAISKAGDTEYIIRTTTSEELKGSNWQDSCRLLVMPGGHDLPYCKELNGTGNAKISGFVTSGGSYLGICAGAYYGSSYVEFDKGVPGMEVVGPRELAFFKVKAIGPVFPGFHYGTNEGAHAAAASITQWGKSMCGIPDETVSLFFNGGCYFLPNMEASEVPPRGKSHSQQYSPLLMYTGQSQPSNPDSSWAPAPAIIGGPVGAGKVILTGLHFEASVALLKEYYPDDSRIDSLLPTLEKFEAQRKQIFNSCIAYLLS